VKVPLFGVATLQPQNFLFMPKTL